MIQEFTTKDIPMISDTLAQLNDAGTLTARQLADLLNLAPSSAYRYLSGETELSFSQYRTLFRQCRCQRAQEQLLTDLLDGTGWFATPLGDPDADLDTRRAVDQAIHASTHVADALTSLRAFEKSGFTDLSPGDLVAPKESIRLAILRLTEASRSLDLLAGQAKSEVRSP